MEPYNNVVLSRRSEASWLFVRKAELKVSFRGGEMELNVVRKATAPESFRLRREREFVVVSKAESSCKLFQT